MLEEGKKMSADEALKYNLAKKVVLLRPTLLVKYYSIILIGNFDDLKYKACQESSLVRPTTLLVSIIEFEIKDYSGLSAGQPDERSTSCRRGMGGIW